MATLWGHTDVEGQALSHQQFGSSDTITKHTTKRGNFTLMITMRYNSVGRADYIYSVVDKDMNLRMLDFGKTDKSEDIIEIIEGWDKPMFWE